MSRRIETLERIGKRIVWIKHSPLTRNKLKNGMASV